jgi:hypothetical protein
MDIRHATAANVPDSGDGKVSSNAWNENHVLSTSTQVVTSAASVTPTFSDDLVTILAQSESLTLENWSGTPSTGWGLFIRIKDNGTPRAISYGTKYRAFGSVLPSSTTASTTLYLSCIYNSDDDKIDVVGAVQQV